MAEPISLFVSVAAVIKNIKALDDSDKFNFYIGKKRV